MLNTHPIRTYGIARSCRLADLSISVFLYDILARMSAKSSQGIHMAISDTHRKTLILHVSCQRDEVAKLVQESIRFCDPLMKHAGLQNKGTPFSRAASYHHQGSHQLLTNGNSPSTRTSLRPNAYIMLIVRHVAQSIDLPRRTAEIARFSFLEGR